ncbi:MAG: T9SS type A sorting domain-containing protein [Flavobacteriales bacterium]|nr:T9SS type A sorting domain-containing protein [Flavobacteriales bacterium]
MAIPMKNTDHLRIAGALIFLTAGLNLCAQTINAYRYWFDDDVATMVTTTVADAQPYTLNDVDAAALSAGYHRVTLQFKDSDDAWGVPVTSLFYRNSGSLVAYQYWYDDDVSSLTETTVGPANLIDIATLVDASALLNGPHTITLRTKDQQNGFSVPITYGFDVVTGIAELRGVHRVVLFPNPALQQITLRVDASSSQDLRVAVLDATGRVVRVEERWNVSGMAIRFWDLSDLASGSYVMHISKGEDQLALPFVKHQ